MEGLAAPRGGERGQDHADRQAGGLAKNALLVSGGQTGHVDPSDLVRALDLAAPAARLCTSALNQLLEALEVALHPPVGRTQRLA
jgi:hypothetical protein